MSRREEAQKRAEIRRRLVEARKVLRELKRHKAAALKQIKRDCKAARVAVRARVKAWRKLQAEIMKAADYGARAQARDACDKRKREAIAKAATAADAALRAIEIEREHLRDQIAKQPSKNPKRVKAGVRTAERIAEAYEEIANNLPPDQRVVFERFQHTPDLRNVIEKASKPGSRVSPTEAILDYFHDHAHLVNDLHNLYDEDAAKMWAERERHWSKLSKAKRLPDDLEDVPF